MDLVGDNVVTWGWKSQLAAKVIAGTGIAAPLVPRDRFFALGYHRIRQNSAGTIWDPSLLGPDQYQFREQMRWLKSHTNIISGEELVDCIENQRPLPPKASMVTFDDAYLDNYTEALPVLSDLKIPAMLFVPTGLIDQQKPGWWDQIHWLFSNSAETRFCYENKTFDLTQERDLAIGWAQEAMKSRPAEVMTSFVDELATILKVEATKWHDGRALLMSWDQIRECDRAGFSVGCHTVTHRVLSTLAPEDQRWELRESKAKLEKELDREVPLLAYPVGEEEHISDETPTIAAELGFKAALTFYTGVGHLGDVLRRPMGIRRFAPADTAEQLAAQVALPSLFVD